LHEAQFGPKGIFRHKLRVDTDAFGPDKPLTEISQLGRRSNRLVQHGELIPKQVRLNEFTEEYRHKPPTNRVNVWQKLATEATEISEENR
jgi:hypothetical protein